MGGTCRTHSDCDATLRSRGTVCFLFVFPSIKYCTNSERFSRYEKLKALTRGRRIDQKKMQDFVLSLKDQIPDSEIERLMKLTPATYLGVAEALAEDV